MTEHCQQLHISFYPPLIAEDRKRLCTKPFILSLAKAEPLEQPHDTFYTLSLSVADIASDHV